MSEPQFVSLQGKLHGFGPVTFLEAAQKSPGSDFVQVFYAVNGERQELAIVMDLTKDHFLDDTDIPEADAAIEARYDEIRRAVVTALNLG